MRTRDLKPVNANQSSRVENNRAADTVNQAPNPLPNDEGVTEPRISPKPTENQSIKVEKNKTIDTVEKALNMLPMTLAKITLAKLTAHYTRT